MYKFDFPANDEKEIQKIRNLIQKIGATRRIILIFISKRAKLNLVNVADYDFKIDLSQIKEYSKNTTISLNKDALNALKNARNDLPKNYDFIILSGYRTLEEQTNIVKLMEVELKKSHPDNYEELLKIYTGGYEELKLKTFSHNNHRSGYAVDLKLTKNNKEADLGGQKMDERDKLPYYDNPISKKEQTIKENRSILKHVLTKNGFENNPNEWWHWGYIKK